MRQSYYQSKSVGYGISRTRLRKILELVGNLRGKRVLDVGCTTGYLGTKIRKMGNYVVGIEISEEAALEARKVLDKVFTFDIEKQWPVPICERSFDLVILAELLEHVFDPVEVLKSVSQVLNPGGFIIVTTPNFMTWTNRAKFLVGNFKYQGQGMFDFGHIRFFTYNFLKKVLSEANFQIIEERHIIFPGKLTPILKYWPSLFAWQFILKAEKIITSGSGILSRNIKRGGGF